MWLSYYCLLSKSEILIILVKYGNFVWRELLPSNLAPLSDQRNFKVAIAEQHTILMNTTMCMHNRHCGEYTTMKVELLLKKT